MKVKRIHLKSFKRFTDLEIFGIPETVKLVVVVGPNGSGKSSLFDAFIHWHRLKTAQGFYPDEGYFRKGDETGFSWDQSVTIETYEEKTPTKNSLYIRTAYRNDPDFELQSISAIDPTIENLRFHRLIENDQVVSQNYQRLVFSTVSQVYDNNNDNKIVKELRSELIGDIRSSMHQVFQDLTLNDISDPFGHGTFTFKKGTVSSYAYKNLSGGEKAAFDLLLDIHLKRKFYSDSIWCIDELETHLHTRVQGALMKEIYRLIPDRSQLWISTHSLGVMRAAQALSVEAPGTVALLDFAGVEPDNPCQLSPSNIGRIAWEKMLSIAIDDLSNLVIPETIIVCEGSNTGTRRKNFDADIYNQIFGKSYPHILFISGGSSSQVANSGITIQEVLQYIAKGARVISLCDRDDKSDMEVAEFEKSGNIVLRKRNLECYLLSNDVLEKFAESVGKADKKQEIINIKNKAIEESIKRGKPTDDLKSASGQIYVSIRRLLQLQRCGSNADAFMKDILAPLITPGMQTYQEMKAAIIDRLKPSNNFKHEN
jgi:predicted ATPase